MRSRDIIRALLDHGCKEVRQKGSHKVFVSPCGKCTVVVPVHAGRDVLTGTAAGIERTMAPCLGPKWLKHSK